MELSLAEQYLLLAIKDESGAWAAGDTHVMFSLAGSVIIELTQKGFLKIEDKKVHVLKDTLTSDPILDSVLSFIKDSKKLRSTKHWIDKIANKFNSLKKDYLQRLQDKAILRLEEGKVLWVFNTKKYPTENPIPEMNLRQDIRNIVMAGSTPTPEQAALISLAYVSDLANEIFEKEERKEAKKKMKEILKDTSAVDPVAQMIQEIQAAMVIVIATAVVITTSSSS